MLTAFVDLKADNEGRLARFRTDEDAEYYIANPIKGYKPEGNYRGICGYEPLGDNRAMVYTLHPAQYLRDSTATPVHDPLAVTAVWRTPRYVNMHLRPMTRGGQQYWGFCIDSICGTTAHVSLYHRQNDDPLAYSQDVYASLPIDSLPNPSQIEEISLTFETFQGSRTWTLPKQ